MLPGLDGIAAATVIERLALLKYRNARGSHIYICPSGEHRFTVLDDLDETTLARLSAAGFNPCAVVETSPGNFQTWLKHATMFPRLLGSFAAQTLALDTMPTQVRPTGGDCNGCPASLIASRSIADRTASSLSYGSLLTDSHLCPLLAIFLESYLQKSRPFGYCR